MDQKRAINVERQLMCTVISRFWGPRWTTEMFMTRFIRESTDSNPDYFKEQEIRGAILFSNSVHTTHKQIEKENFQSKDNKSQILKNSEVSWSKHWDNSVPGITLHYLKCFGRERSDSEGHSAGKRSQEGETHHKCYPSFTNNTKVLEPQILWMLHP